MQGFHYYIFPVIELKNSFKDPVYCFPIEVSSLLAYLMFSRAFCIYPTYVLYIVRYGLTAHNYSVQYTEIYEEHMV